MSQGLVHPATGLREDLADVISVIDQKNTPVTSRIKAGSDLTNGSVFSWQADSYNDPSFDGVLTNADVTTFDDPAKNRVLLSGRAQKFRRSIKVDDFAQNVDNVAGVGKKKEMARGVSRALIELKRDMESAFCSSNDSQEQSGTNPYKTRGLGSWISNSAQTDLPVPASFRTPSASINTTATSSLTESDVAAVLQSVYEQTGTIDTMDLVTGPNLKKRFSEFTRYSSGSNTALSTRQYTASLNDRTVISTVDTYIGDFGTINLVPTLFNAKDAAAAVQSARGYLLNMSMLETRYGRRPRFQELEDQGGGPRGLVDAIAALVCWNPKGLGKFAATS
ncbi:MAG: hypothetical protein RL753_747 [Bacteroidota bacterium]